MTKHVLLILFAVCAFVANAQVSVTGKVTDNSGKPIQGAVVVVKGTSTAVRTGSDGTYSITVPKEQLPTSLEVRAVGLGTKEIAVDGLNPSITQNVSMGSLAKSLNEVVVSASKKSEKVLNAPASVSTLSEARIQQNTSLSAVDNLRKTAAVDIMPTGLVSNNVNVRGNNGIFSGSMLYMIDNRIASVPSLRVNAFQLVPTSNVDLTRMEVVRGPASALYGPFASQGVLAMYTKSPLDMDNRMEVTLGLTTGMRAQDNDQPAFGFKADNSIEKLGILSPEIRIAAKLSKQIGVKVSANYMSATDFAYFDNREPNQGTSIRFGDQSGGSAWRQRGSETGVFNRDFSIKKISTDARLDFRPADNIELIFNGGYANNTNMELTGLGAAQARDWTSTYFQTRLKVGKLFLQYFLNQTNSGSTFLIPQSTTQRDFSYLGEQSSLQSIQGQHSTDLINNKLNLVYGVDIFLTRPRGNVYGRFDNGGANINQYGAYAQGKYQFNKQWSFTGALRADYQDVIDEWMFSPRAALMYKPEENQTFRLTYNRAFQAPGALNFFLDLNNARFPNGGNARGFGNGTGFTYGTTALGQGPFAGQNNTLINLPSQGQQLPLTGITTNPTFIGFSRAYTAQAMIGSLANGGVPAALAGSIVTKTLAGLAPTQMAFTDITTGKNVNLANVKDREAVKSTVNQTFEAGYKGQIGEKLTLGLDLYYTRIENFVSPLTAASYALTFDESFFNNPATAGQIATNLSTLSAQESAILKTALLGNASATTSETVAAVLRNYYTLNNASSPAIFGPQGTGYERDILLTYFNLGTIDYAGADFQANYQATDDLNIDFAYSHINKDRIITNEVPEGYIALNAPKHKTAMTLSYNLPIDNKSVALNAGWRWMDKFIANSAVYKGFVNAANLFDLGLTWRPSSSQGTIIGLNAINLLDHRHQFFPGTPEMGRVVMLKLQHTFGVK